FGVVGGGVADLITKNEKEILDLLGTGVNIKRILDLRDFPSSPFGKLVTHSFDEILNDSEIDTVIEVMGGSHPAYEYTVAALKAGKNVITSNKEVVAGFGDEFLALAKQMGVSYRFEAAVGGGIPVISPVISCVRHNKVSEIRGILNGTTNYILTKMFTYGDSFEASLKDAQERGYAERNPDADILGIDACRKIAILTALVTGKLPSPEKIHTEGIVGIRANDVAAAAKLKASIKLLGRCIIDNGEPVVMVAPFIIPKEAPLSTVSGVYNAIEVIADPLGNVMFYGQGAGAGATASAVVGDLMQTAASGRSCINPEFEKFTPENEAFEGFKTSHYLALDGINKRSVKEIFGAVQFIECGGELEFITAPLCEKDVAELCQKATALGASILSHIRCL
ncbi:MAG: homoserine dehydrogenase, partial [Clostridia bacterium]|nr:homoserine dehydrogenase [Clostridia bacterium]